jgi:hypothetical protein
MINLKAANQNIQKVEILHEMLDHLFMAREIALELNINEDIDLFFTCIADAIRDEYQDK